MWLPWSSHCSPLPPCFHCVCAQPPYSSRWVMNSSGEMSCSSLSPEICLHVCIAINTHVISAEYVLSCMDLKRSVLIRYLYWTDSIGYKLYQYRFRVQWRFDRLLCPLVLTFIPAPDRPHHQPYLFSWTSACGRPSPWMVCLSSATRSFGPWLWRTPHTASPPPTGTQVAMCLLAVFMSEFVVMLTNRRCWHM